MAKMQNRERLLRKMERLPTAARQSMRVALDQSAGEIVDMQKRLVPRRSGALQNSIGYTFGNYRPDNSNVRGVSAGAEGADPDLSVTIHAGDATAFYAAFVEFGTAPHPQPNNPRIGYSHPGANAQPFFFPAYRALKRRVKSRITRAAKKAARDVAGGGS